VKPGHIADVDDDEGIALIKSGFAQAYHGGAPRVERAMATPVRHDGMMHYDKDFIPAQPVLEPEAPQDDEGIEE
jgi:hypothetical protein